MDLFKYLKIGLISKGQASDPGATPAGGMYYNTTSNTWRFSNGSVWQDLGAGSGSGSGAKNYITNPDAENDTNGWFTFADAAAPQPQNGFGGSPLVTITRSTSSPLRGNASFVLTKNSTNRQGDGVSFGPNGGSFDFTIDAADTNKPFQVSLDFLASAGYLPNDVGIWIYDTTGSKLLQSSQNLIPYKSGTFTATFNTTTSQTYRLIVYVASTNAAAWTFKFDGVFFGAAQNVVLGPVMSDIEVNVNKFTPSVPGYGVVTNDVWLTKQIGDEWSVEGFFDLAAANASSAKIALPSGYLLNTTKVSGTSRRTKVGSWTRVANSGGTGISVVNQSGDVFIDDADSGNVYLAGVTGSNLYTDSNVNNIANSNDSIALKFTIPIQGFSSNVITANSRVFKASDYLAVGTRVTGTPPTNLGEYRSFLRITNTQTYSETNGDPAIPPSIANGIALYPANNYSGGDAANQPSRYDVFVGKNKSVQVQFYSSVGRTGHYDPDILIIGSTTVGTGYSYDPTTGIVSVTVFVNGSAPNAGGMGIDELGDPFATQSYFDIIVSDNPLPVQVEADPVLLKHVLPSLTDAGAFNSGSWQTRVLNTVENPKPWLTLSSNQFTLDAGKYLIRGSAPAYQVSNHQTKIYNITDSSDALLGTSESISLASQTRSEFEGIVIITATKVFELQHQCTSTKATNGFGNSCGFGNDEVYAELSITKLA